MVRDTREGFIRGDREEMGPHRVRQIEAGTLKLSRDEKSFLAFSQ